MAVAVIENRSQSILDADHVGFARPVKTGKSSGLLEVIPRRVVAICKPIDAADELAPAKDLADEAFDRIEWGVTRPQGVDGCTDALSGIEQLEVQGRRQEGVKQPRLVSRHRILVIAEPG
jgi:hypothetical protein